MNHWANYFAVISSDSRFGNAGFHMPPEESAVFSTTIPGLPLKRYPHKLFLQVLLGSFFLVAAGSSAHAAIESSRPTSLYQQQQNRLYTLSGQQAPAIQYEHFPKAGNHSFTCSGHTKMAIEHPPTVRLASQVKTPNSARSNGAILAHQVSASSKPMPTARRGVDTASPLLEGWNIKEKQICTKGYPDYPGTPKPVFAQGAGHLLWQDCFPQNQISKASNNHSIRNL